MHGEALLSEAMKSATDTAVKNHFEKEGDKPAYEPKIELMNKEWKSGDDVQLSIEYECMPKIPDLDLSKFVLENVVAEPDKKSLDEAMNNLRESGIEYNPLKGDRKSKKKDQVTLKYLIYSYQLFLTILKNTFSVFPIFFECFLEISYLLKSSGINFNTVINNLSLHSEYASMSTPGGTQKAILIKGFWKLADNLDVLILHRNYDLGFDNPYQKSFSEYQRYKSSIFEDEWWLEDPIYTYLYQLNPQPQAEKGTYLESRYQFHEKFVLNLLF